MANNRMYLREKVSGKELLLAKYYMPTWGAWRTQEELEEWFGQFESDKLFGPTTFELRFESSEDDQYVADARRLLTALHEKLG